MTRMISQTWVFKVFHFCFHDFKGKQLINLQQNQTRPSIFDRAAVIYCPEKKKKKEKWMESLWKNLPSAHLHLQML